MMRFMWPQSSINWYAEVQKSRMTWGMPQHVRPALGHEDTDQLFLRVHPPGRAEGAVPAEASGHAGEIVAPR